MENQYYPFVNTPLPYPYNGLEPYIDEKTMRLHHDKHLQTYIQNLNDILKQHPELQKFSLTQLLQNTGGMSQPLGRQIRNNAGGVYNHRFYFNGLKNPSDNKPTDSLLKAILYSFGSLEEFEKQLKAAALSVFGSGYAWLVCQRGQLQIMTTPNQNTPIEQGLHPILAVDVWEHAYYLKHFNVRANYVDDWLSIINWSKAKENYQNCISAQ